MKDKIFPLLTAQFPEIDFQFEEFRDELTITFPKVNIVEVCDFLKVDPEMQFMLLEDVTAIDWARRKNRFSVVYHIYSLHLTARLRLMVSVEEEDAVVDSVTGIWKTANWHERETYDMYGITFNHHPDLRRMYMPEEFEYYPLRKEFPLMGIPGSIPLPKK